MIVNRVYLFSTSGFETICSLHKGLNCFCFQESKDDTKQNTADMTQFVQNLLTQMQTRFQTMSDSIVSKIDEMGERISELEQSINDLRAEMGAEGTQPPPSPSKKDGSA